MTLTRPGRKRSQSTAHVEALEGRAYFALIAFEPVTLLPAGSFPSGLAVADLNADGNVDIVETNYGDGTVGVLMGRGDGTFAPMVTYPVGNGPESIVVADVNGDGIPDLIVANSGQNAQDPGNTNSNSISVLLGTGGGAFAPAVSYATGGTPTSLVAADFNGDGHIDIATSNLSDNTISILDGNGDGTFGSPTAVDAGPRPMGLAVADFNRDGHPDLAVANSSDSTVSVLINRGDGTFKTRVAYDVGNYPRAVIATDLGHAGRISIIATDLEDATFSILHGNNDGTFQTQTAIVSGVNPFGIAAGDLNDNNRVDLVTANGNGTVSVRQRNDTGYTLDRGVFATGAGPQNVAIADVNGDGKPDLITTDFADNTIGILLNDTPRPGEKATTSKLTAAPNPSALTQSLVLTATIKSDLGKPTGTVAFYDNGNAIGTAAIGDKGVATFTTTTLPSGSNALTAQYLGDGTFAESVSKAVAQIVTTTAASGPDLVATFGSTGLGSQFVPGESGSATFNITNQGNVRATGTVNTTLYLSPDGLLDDATPLTIAGPLASSKIKLNPGQSVSLSATFTVPGGLATGAYAIVADANYDGSVAEADTSNNVGASAAVYNAVNKFGAVGGISNVTLTLADSAGTPVNFRLSGPGTAEVDPSAAGLDITLTGTTAATTLTIATTTGGPDPVLNALNDDSPLGSLAASIANFTGPINLNGGVNKVAINNLTGTAAATAGLNIGGSLVKSIVMDSVTYASLSTPGGIKSLTVNGWSNTADDRITAGYIGTLKSAGTFGPAMQLTGQFAPRHGATLNSIVVGLFTGAASIAGRLNSFTAQTGFNGTLAATAFGSINIGGSFSGDILAGANLGDDVAVGGGDDTFGVGTLGSLRIAGTTDGLIAAGLDPVNDALDGDYTLLPGGRIGSITVGPTTTATRFLADKLPPTATIQGNAVGTANDPRFHV